MPISAPPSTRRWPRRGRRWRAIADQEAAPTFANTIAALELAEGALDRVSGVFYNLAGADSTEAREALMRDLAPKMSAFASEVTNNKRLFARIDDLWARRDGLGLEPEQMRVLTLYRRMFVRSGAELEGAAAERLTAVKARLAVLGTQFSQNLLADEREWFMELAEDDLEGLPDFVVDARAGGGQGAGAERAGGDAEPVADRAVPAILAPAGFAAGGL